MKLTETSPYLPLPGLSTVPCGTEYDWVFLKRAVFISEAVLVLSESRRRNGTQQSEAARYSGIELFGRYLAKDSRLPEAFRVTSTISGSAVISFTSFHAHKIGGYSRRKPTNASVSERTAFRASLKLSRSGAILLIRSSKP